MSNVGTTSRALLTDVERFHRICSELRDGKGLVSYCKKVLSRKKTTNIFRGGENVGYSVRRHETHLEEHLANILSCLLPFRFDVLMLLSLLEIVTSALPWLQSVRPKWSLLFIYTFDESPLGE